MKIKLVILISLFVGKLNAQFLQSSVISSGSDDYKQVYASMNWTIGEVICESFSNENYYFNQGFQQGEFGKKTSLNEESVLGSPIILFPNPTSTIVNLKLTQNFTIKKLTVEVYNVLGQLKWTENFDEESISLDVSIFPTGLYIVKVFDENGLEFLEKFQKN